MIPFSKSANCAEFNTASFFLTFDFIQIKMALENFLWEFGGERQEWLKPRSKRNDEDMTTEADVDMLRNVQVNQKSDLGNL